ncbi:MAG: MoxR family ATPase [Candidatus Brocadiae bacterium]|nr:MoxR family ATPase [Candidatus Brocadiia bacterium]
MSDAVQENSEAVQDQDVQEVERFRDACAQLREEIRHVIVGQQDVVEEVLLAMFSRGHCLLEGVPGLAKTLLVRTLARVLHLDFHRIQFTPDLMPSDIIGTDILRENKETGERFFEFVHGPLFANIVLADEINRTPPKTQAALLEAMQEHRVTTGGKEYFLREPFLVLATQNPIEQEGTYPLPEAQLDRFMFHIRVDYPGFEDEIEVVRRTTTQRDVEVKHILTGEDIVRLQDLVYRIPVPEHVYRYAVTLVRKTRRDEADTPDYVREWVAWGAGPRASQYLVLGAKARSILYGRGYASVEDVKAVAGPVLRHRILLNFNAEAAGVTSEHVIARLMDEMPVIEPAA